MKQNFAKFHEEEVIFLKSTKPMALKELRDCLAVLKFEEIDDFFL